MGTNNLADYDRLYAECVAYCRESGAVNLRAIQSRFNLTLLGAVHIIDRMVENGVAVKLPTGGYILK